MLFNRLDLRLGFRHSSGFADGQGLTVAPPVCGSTSLFTQDKQMKPQQFVAGNDVITSVMELVSPSIC